MKKDAILHIPASNYAFGLDDTHMVFRLRAAKGDLTSCTFCYGDRACRKNPIEITKVKMTVTAQDEYFDYFEVTIETEFTRVCYYFEISDGSQVQLYYADIFGEKLPAERSELFQLPFNHRDDRTDIPQWFNEAVVYNIFPDSYATSHRYISGKGLEKPAAGQTCKSKNGGTLTGILENLDAIRALGITCIYLNPIFTAGEYHKYDVLDYYDIDPCFGTKEEFKQLVDTCHENGIHVILDIVINHCSWHFFAFEDVVQNGESSRHKDWFYRLSYPVVRPDSGEAIPGYDCFAYERKMPKLNTANPEVQEYFCRVCAYWLTEFGIDGWRLDVANEVNHRFWRAFRETAKAANPNCVLIGEVWESAPQWLQGDQFDSTMNYDFRKNCRDFFALGQIDSLTFNARVTQMLMRYPTPVAYAQLNLLDSHDVSRFLSVCGDNHARMRLAIAFQMTFAGVPSVYYGDEKGFCGITEDEYRRPMLWDGAEGEPERFYKQMIALRKENPALISGGFRMLHAAAGSGLYIFERFSSDSRIFVALNASNQQEEIPVLGECRLLFAAGLEENRLEPWGMAIYSSEKESLG